MAYFGITLKAKEARWRVLSNLCNAVDRRLRVCPREMSRIDTAKSIVVPGTGCISTRLGITQFNVVRIRNTFLFETSPQLGF